VAQPFLLALSLEAAVLLLLGRSWACPPL